MKDMIGYSGLDCETCDAYIATVHDDLVLREKTAKLWAGLNNAPILPEHINCEGCRKHGAKTAFRSVFMVRPSGRRAQPKSVKPSRSPLCGIRSGLVKSSVQSESKTAGSFTFAVLGKAADGQYRHTLRGGFFQRCLKSSPRRGLYFPARQSFILIKNVLACANVYLTSIVIRQITNFQLHPRAGKYVLKKRR